MFNFKQNKGLLKSFQKNDDGNMALTFALSLTLVVTAVGAATDFSALSSAHSKSQSVADSLALTAAIYVKDNDRPPTDDTKGLRNNVTYTAEDLNLSFNNSIEGGDAGVEIKVVYDDNAKTATTTVSGATAPNFTQVFGKDRLPFTAKSVVSYLETENSFPASIALVLDNSGSMQFDDKLAVNIHDVTHRTPYTARVLRTVQTGVDRRGRPIFGRRFVDEKRIRVETHEHGDRQAGTQIRLDGLKNSIIKFQTDLRSRLDETEAGTSRRTLRMGMLPYSSAINEDKRIEMTWGYLEEGSPDPRPFDGINAGSGIEGMIADGGTNSSPPMMVARDWMMNEDAFHTREAEDTNTVDKEALKFVIFMTDGQNSVGNWEFTPGRTGKFWRQQFDGSYRQVRSRFGAREGTALLLTDQETVEACEKMHDEGVTIFTIGYALEDFGKFRVNGWDGKEDDELFEVANTVQSAAYSLMENCASSPDHFIQAGDASKLEAAFDEIQNAIVEELIRIKS